MRCRSFDWILSGVQGVQIACTIAQAQELATLHGNVFIQASTAPSAAAGAAALGSGGAADQGDHRAGGQAREGPPVDGEELIAVKDLVGVEGERGERGGGIWKRRY